MNIDFNNVRRGAISNFSALVKTLNDGLNSGNGDGMIVVSADELQRSMDNLRNDLVAIGATYKENDPEFICILDDKTHIPEFNPDPQDTEDKSE
jgi:hypothetical protein